MLLALVLRVAGIGFGLPAEYRPDEDQVVGRAIGILAGQPDVHFYFWPAAYFYLLSVPFAALAEVRHVLGWGPPLFTSAFAAAAGDAAPYLMTARVIGALWGIALVVLVWRLGRRIGGPRVGVIAALVATVCEISVRESHFGLFDPAAAVAVALALLLACGSGDRWRWLAAGAACGVAAGLKYHPGLVLLPALFLGWGAGWRARLQIAGGALAAFLVCEPMLWFHPGDTLRGLTYGVGLAGRSVIPPPVPAWFFYLLQALPAAFGIPALAMALSGAAWAVAHRSRTAGALVLHVCVVLAILSSAHTFFFRYLLTLVPALSVLAGLGLAWLADLAGGPRTAALAVAMMCAAVPPLSRDVALDRLLLTTDTRTVAYAWLVSHVPAGSSLATGYYGGPLHGQAQVDANRGAGPGRALILNRLAPFAVRLLPDHGAPAAPQPGTWVVVTSPAPRQKFGAAPLGAAVFRMDAAEGPDPVYDWEDSFYVPIDGFDGVTAPGPAVVVYQPAGD